MTQIRGIYCGACHRRYVQFAFKNGPICKHHYGRIDGIGMIAPATFIYSFAWRYREGFQAFILQKIHYLIEDGEAEGKLTGDLFKASYVSGRGVELQFLEFLKAQHSYEWPIWTESFVSLFLGGAGQTMIPGWRWRQMEREFEKEVEHDAAEK